MLQEMLRLLPKEAGTVALIVAVVGALLGAALWLRGSKYSRYLVTLMAVAIGSIVGLYLPLWYDTGLDGSATAVVGSLVLGITGFVFQRFWVGVGLGAVLAVWAAFATWFLCRGQSQVVWPVGEAAQTLPGFLVALWENLPADVKNALPIGCGLAFAAGGAGASIWPRFGQVCLYSCAGVTLLMGMGLWAVESFEPAWVLALPADTTHQLLALASMVAIGAYIQWRQLAPAGATSSKNAGKTGSKSAD